MKNHRPGRGTPMNYHQGYNPQLPYRKHGRKLLVASGIAVVVIAIGLAIANNHTTTPPSDSSIQQSYQVGHDEVGGFAFHDIAERPQDSAQTACEWASGLWLNYWHNGSYDHVPHSSNPAWWDTDTVMRACLDDVGGR